MTNRHIVHTLDQKESKAKPHHSKKQSADEGFHQLTYTTPHVKGSGASNPTMVLLVNKMAYQTWKKDPVGVAVANVVDSFDVLKYEMGRSGMLSKPSKSELDATFGTSKSDQIVQFMLEQGALHHKAM